jgi:hypothetical protein
MNTSQPLEILIDSKDRLTTSFGVNALGHVSANAPTVQSRFAVEFDPPLVFKEGSYLKLEKVYMPAILFNVPENATSLTVGLSNVDIGAGSQITVTIRSGNYSVKSLVEELNTAFLAAASGLSDNAVVWTYDPISFQITVSKYTSGVSVNSKIYFRSNRFIADALGFPQEDTSFTTIHSTQANSYHRSGFIHLNILDIVGTGATQCSMGDKVLNANWVDTRIDFSVSLQRPKFVGFTIPNYVTPGEVLVYTNESMTANIIGPILKPSFSRLVVEITDRDGNLLVLNADWYFTMSVLEREKSGTNLVKRLPK